MTDRDDALRRELGWTGSEEEDFEPDTGPSGPRMPPPIPHRPPADGPSPAVPYVPPPADVPTVVGDPQRRASFRETQQMPAGPPPPPPHQHPSGWGQPPGWEVPRGQRPTAGPPPAGPPTMGPPPQQVWPQEGYGPAGPMASPPGSYADRIRVNDLVPPRRTPPARGWRRLVFKASFGLINPGQSPDELRQIELENQIRGVLRGHYKVGVMGKGGVGKTTVSASVGSVFAELRQDDRVVAIDADTAFGKLGSRVDPNAQGSYWELASDQHLESFADVRSRVGNNAAGLFVLAGEGTPARRRVLDPAIYREATARLDRYFSISIVDCSSTMDSPVTQEVLRDLDALIVVSSPWVDGAAAAGQTLDWLAARGMTGLLQRTVVVLNDSDGHADKRTRSILAQQFAGHGQRVIEIPFDGHLRPGGVISGTREMSPAARRKFLELAAALAEHFPSTDDRSRERG
ncbi:MinD/ParA family ATP-binding protein [Mycolicibacterium litorale]|uniref:ATPase n=1 Tax=Mycolicibacterium litorale TaxID=758802 RepID=A0AAD1IME7_9MYCO|nr:MinD/ParA family protein [Mycolicibacterium litorale]MCV7417319.1 MinD/ParA family protein [Mycolicibacterium litorale]TDY05109.1 MinD-like ATPase involved in chromosome partitioning or flagellar assembly [Mycolicibacterium litorale]BBY18542.1 ATPase [Mycolicibacterium litorale]